ncbi:MAG: methylmalonyl-CoA epimerase, partial [Actinomycetota bacterium]
DRSPPTAARGGPQAKGALMLMRIDHIGIAVEDLDASVEHYRRTLGIEPVHRERVESQGVEEVLLAVGDSYVQLLGALGPDTPVGRFLARQGQGVHHVGYRVEDLARALAHLKAEGVRLIDEAPRLGSRGTSIAFVHPKGMGGVLVELVQDGAGSPA